MVTSIIIFSKPGLVFWDKIFMSVNFVIRLFRTAVKSFPRQLKNSSRPVILWAC